ncbi:Phosphoribosylaminoimidazole-succinocarboxamide synthase (SAICAR synthetase) [Orobanche gracilis]
MAQQSVCINPPKNLTGKPFLRSSSPSIVTHSYRTIFPESFTRKKFHSMIISSSSSPIVCGEPPKAPCSVEVLPNSERKNELMSSIQVSLSNCLSETHLDSTVPGLQSKTRGKVKEVRDVYDGGDYLVLVTTDRQSAFDRVLASIPFKGQVLNETSLWWFNKTKHIIPNAVVSSPDRNVTIARKCSVFPVEFVVRGYVTGSTDTSLWTVYEKGVRNYCGNALPDGMVKNQKLPANILTPTTKSENHDAPITPQEIIQLGLMSQADYDEASKAALSLFEFGQYSAHQANYGPGFCIKNMLHAAEEHGLILVDTKYEFGKGSDGTLLLIDEVHTPDSSRYWIAHSYEDHFQSGLEPENIDKEFLRLWFKDHCNPYDDEVLPDAPEELVSELAWRYILLYETITKSKFEIPSTKEPIHDRISRNVSHAISALT